MRGLAASLRGWVALAPGRDRKGKTCHQGQRDEPWRPGVKRSGRHTPPQSKGNASSCPVRAPIIIRSVLARAVAPDWIGISGCHWCPHQCLRSRAAIFRVRPDPHRASPPARRPRPRGGILLGGTGALTSVFDRERPVFRMRLAPDQCFPLQNTRAFPRPSAIQLPNRKSTIENPKWLPPSRPLRQKRPQERHRGRRLRRQPPHNLLRRHPHRRHLHHSRSNESLQLAHFRSVIPLPPPSLFRPSYFLRPPPSARWLIKWAADASPLFPPRDRAIVKAIACAAVCETNLPLSRLSTSDLACVGANLTVNDEMDHLASGSARWIVSPAFTIAPPGRVPPKAIPGLAPKR